VRKEEPGARTSKCEIFRSEKSEERNQKSKFEKCGPCCKLQTLSFKRSNLHHSQTKAFSPFSRGEMSQGDREELDRCEGFFRSKKR